MSKTLPSLIETKRLELRPFTPNDVATVYDYSLSDPDWPRFQGLPSPYTPKHAEEFVLKLIAQDAAQPARALVFEGVVVGIVNLKSESDWRIAVIGYGVHKKQWGRGLASEAVRAVLAKAFEVFPQLHKVGARTDARNARSIRVLENAGFQREGTVRASQFVNGEFVDGAFFGILREEWFNRP